MSQNSSTGFDPHVQDQLSRMSLNQQPHAQTQGQTKNRQRQPLYSQTPPMDGVSNVSFPPLGVPTQRQPYQNHLSQPQPAAEQFFRRPSSQSQRQARQTYQQRPYIQQNQQNQQYSQQPQVRQNQHYSRGYNQGYNQRSQGRQYQNSYSPEDKRRTMEQSDYLEDVLRQNHGNMLTVEEINQKQIFSKSLEQLARQAFGMPNAVVKLVPYGSLVNSFGLSGCDIDLLLTIEDETGPLEVPDHLKRLLESVFLSRGIGARLLPNTRVPILQVCEKPTPELLQDLRENLRKVEEAAAEKAAKAEKQKSEPQKSVEAESDNKNSNAETSVTETTTTTEPLPETPRIEFTSEHGFQCDINFSGHVAVHNSRMLWTYGQIDERVRPMGVFIKNWAKARDINTPYRGTLSSYGYVLMVLHYCMNVARPAIIPNLQELGRGWDDQPPEKLFQDKYDIRYEGNLKKIRQNFDISGQRNHALGRLLRGFFEYYGSPGGFQWMNSVISIRTPGGILSKESKGWVKAQWDSTIRQRYLLAIEDPFETDHNVARTIGHNGINAIRDEFRRAWTLINAVRKQGSTWVNGLGEIVDLMARTEGGHGDTLKQDADFRKLRQMKAKLDKEQEQLEKASNQGEQSAEWGKRKDELIRVHQLQDEKVGLMRKRLPDRQRISEPEDSDDDVEDSVVKTEFSPVRPPKSEPSVEDTWADESQVEPARDEWADQSQAELPAQDSWSSEPHQNTDRIPERNQQDDWADHSLQATQFENSWVDQQEQIPVVAQETTPVPWADEPVVPSQSEYGAASETAWNDHSNEEPIIPWTEKSKVGRWLLMRDRMIADGSWIYPTYGQKARLSSKFRYSTTYSLEEIEKMNILLETEYKDTFHRSRNGENCTRSENASWLSEEQKAEIAQQALSIPVTQFQQDRTIIGDVGVDIPASDNDFVVGAEIPWSTDTDIGRWLNWRDRKIKAGIRPWTTPRAHHGLFEKIDDAFPHSKDRKLSEFEKMDDEIKAFFSNLECPHRDQESKTLKRNVYELHTAVDALIQQRQTADVTNADETFTEAEAVTQADGHEQESVSGIHVPIASFTDEREDAREAVPVESVRIPPVLPRRAVSFATPIQTINVYVSPIQSPRSWTSTNDVGLWLQGRDEMIENGKWRDPTEDKTNIFWRLCHMYPYEYRPSKTNREKQNIEIEEYFSEVNLPADSDLGADVYRIILKVMDARKNRGEKARIETLLNIFSKDRLEGLEIPNNNAQALRQNQKNNQEESMKAVQAFSDQLSHKPEDGPETSKITQKADEHVTGKAAARDVQSSEEIKVMEQQAPRTQPPAVTPTDTSKEDQRAALRQAKLAYYDRVVPAPSTSSKQNFHCHCCSHADKTQLSQSQLRQIRGRNDHFDPHEPATTDESAGEVVPNTLAPNTWRVNRKHRYEDPRIMPIPRRLDFPFDRKQISDIDAMVQGGNGCVRDNAWKFTVESDEYSWCGGGAMAQRSASPATKTSRQSVSTSRSEKYRELLEELPNNL